MANYPEAQTRLAAAIDLLFTSPPGPLGSEGIGGFTLEEAAENLAAHVIEDYTSIADTRSRGNITVWKIFGSDWDMFDGAFEVTITSGKATRLLSLKIIINKVAGGKWTLDLFDWASDPPRVGHYQGRSKITTDPNGNDIVILDFDPEAPSAPGTSPSRSRSPSRGTG